MKVALSPAPPPNAVWLVINAVFGLMAVPWCPHEGCGWQMPDLWCPEHGNFGMTFQLYRRGCITHVKAVLS